MVTVRVVRDFTADHERAVRALAEAVEARDGASPFGDDTWRAFGSTPSSDVGLLLDGPDGGTAAYAHLAHHHDDEWSLEVAARDGAAQARVGLVEQAVAEVAERGGGHVTLWAHGASTDHDALANATGFRPERELLQLRVALPLAAGPQWPEGITVRAFRVGEDEAEWVAVNNRAFAGHPEQGNWTVDMIRARESEPWFDPTGFLVAFDHEGMAGSCWTKVHPADPPDEPDARGEIYVIGADPRWHGRGLGRALTAGGLEWLAGRGLTVGMLYVDGANEAAVGLYRALGFTDHRVDRAYGRAVTPSPS
jgi:mycothiol synthase